MLYKGRIVGLYRADLVVDNRIIIETKCVSSIIADHIYQLKNYLTGTGYTLGYIFNFKNSSVDFKKVFP